MCRHKMCSSGLVCMFHKIWDITNLFNRKRIILREFTVFFAIKFASGFVDRLIKFASFCQLFSDITAAVKVNKTPDVTTAQRNIKG